MGWSILDRADHESKGTELKLSREVILGRDTDREVGQRSLPGRL